MRRRFWVELALAAVTGVLTAVTLISHEWIEFVFGVDPDGGSGLLEWGIVVALGLAAVAFGALSRAEWRRTAANPGASR